MPQGLKVEMLGVRGFPSICQKEGEWMGHGADVGGARF